MITFVMSMHIQKIYIYSSLIYIVYMLYIYIFIVYIYIYIYYFMEIIGLSQSWHESFNAQLWTFHQI